MAVYDLAHRLARGIKDSDEYRTYSTLRQKIMDDEKTKEMLLDFQKEQLKLQTKQLSGQEVTEEEQERFNKLREIVELNKNIKSYLDAEYRVGVLLNDIQRILFSDLEIGIPKEEKKHPDQ